MKTRMLPVAALAAMFVTPAVAAPSTPSQSSGTPGVSEGQNNVSNPTPKIATKLYQSLTQAGFTDVHVVPESFLVRAKDKDGNPVIMVVNPDSTTAITALSSSGNGNSSSAKGNDTAGAPNSSSTTHH
jgi:hypothetical protein